MYSIPLEEYASAATATVAQCIAPSTLNQVIFILYLFLISSVMIFGLVFSLLETLD